MESAGGWIALALVPTPSKSSVRISTAFALTVESGIGSASRKAAFRSRSMLRPVAAMQSKPAISALRHPRAERPERLHETLRRHLPDQSLLRDEAVHRALPTVRRDAQRARKGRLVHHPDA